MEAAAAALAAEAPAAVGLFGGIVFREPRRQRGSAACCCCFCAAALVPLRARGQARTDREDPEQAAGGESMRWIRGLRRRERR